MIRGNLPKCVQCTKSSALCKCRKPMQQQLLNLPAAGIGNCQAKFAFGRLPSSQPSAPAQLPEHGAADNRDEPEDEVVSVLPLELGHMLEVHAIDASNRRRHRQNCSPSRQAARDGSLLCLPNHQAGFKCECQHLAQRIDLLLYAVYVIADITKQWLHLSVDGFHLGVLKAPTDLGKGSGCVAQLKQLAPQSV